MNKSLLSACAARNREPWDQQAAEYHPGDLLARNYWHLHALEEPGEPIAFQLPYGTWIRLFRENNLAIEGLIELCPHSEATSSYCSDRDRD